MSDAVFGGVLSAGPVAEQVGEAAWLQAMLDFEGALARACSEVGVIPTEAAEAIEKYCHAAHYDTAVIGARAVEIGNPAGPLVRELTARVAQQAAGYVHLGATSQDVVDTAAMLVTTRALRALDQELTACANTLAQLATTHVGTFMAGRTLLQQGPPVTFGLTAAGWLSGLTAACSRLRQIRRDRIAVQFGGAVGTLSAFGDDGVDVLTQLAWHLGLEPAAPWHTERSRISEIAGALGQTCATVAKIARDITLLAQTEVGEVWEHGPPGSGASSTMPHKRNPIAAVLAVGSAAQAPGLVANLLAAGAHEHQRAAGSWHAEWRPHLELLCTTGSAVHWLRTSLDRLQVDPDRMRANLDTTGGLASTENVVVELVSASEGQLGRQQAADVVAECCRRALSEEGTLADLLATEPQIAKYLTQDRITSLLDPIQYSGSIAAFVERAVHAWKGYPQ